jgi:hypothetical protein
MTDNTDPKVLPFPEPSPSPEPSRLSKGKRMIIHIGSQRLAFDFFHQVTKLNPEPAPIIPVDSPKTKKPRKSRK